MMRNFFYNIDTEEAKITWVIMLDKGENIGESRAIKQAIKDAA